MTRFDLLDFNDDPMFFVYLFGKKEKKSGPEEFSTFKEATEYGRTKMIKSWRHWGFYILKKGKLCDLFYHWGISGKKDLSTMFKRIYNVSRTLSLDGKSSWSYSFVENLMDAINEKSRFELMEID